MSAMRRSPSGVAIGVSGELHRHRAHPVGHVPFSFGGWHEVDSPTGPGIVQHSSPALQQLAPQQLWSFRHVGPSHGAFPHTP
jgi:hypothetical protein